jgi:transcriptional regulator with XRE-family HTH domain
MVTGKRRSTTSVILDREKLYTLATTSGFTQEEIAGRAGVGLRTVQRAFAGSRVRPFMAKRVAKALGIELPDLISQADAVAQGQTLEHVIAWNCDGGMRLSHALAGARVQSWRVDAEPLPETGDAIVELIERMRELRPESRWLDDTAEHAATLRQGGLNSLYYIKLAATLGGYIRTLMQHKVTVYVGSYVAVGADVFQSLESVGRHVSEEIEDLPAVVIAIAADAGDRLAVPVTKRSPRDPALATRF